MDPAVNIEDGKADATLKQLYGEDPIQLKKQRQRYLDVIEKFRMFFPGDREVHLFSTPGRTEVGGNHTDHNAGRILAAAVDLDIIAAVAINETGTIRVRSDAYPPVEVSLEELAFVEGERYTPSALVRGVCSRMQDDYRLGGFDAFTHSSVPEGSGLSSSAAYEVLIVTILNHLYNDAGIDNITTARIAQYAENEYFGKPCGLMDQTTCAVGGLVTIDFKDFERPIVRKVDFDFSAEDFSVVIVNTGGSHADLHDEYIALEHEMKLVAGELGGSVLRESSEDDVLEKLAALRATLSDRAILRALHFYRDDRRVTQQVEALEKGDFEKFLQLVIASGNSSWMLCQNCYSSLNVAEQGLSVALAVSERLLEGTGAWRVHGGGFAGTIQAFVPDVRVKSYIDALQAVYGDGSCHRLLIRSIGSTHLGGISS